MEYKVGLLDTLALWQNLVRCKDNDTDCFNTAKELENMLQKAVLYIPTDKLESLLCYCNYNREDGCFTHPAGDSFTRMVERILNDDQYFCTLNNYIMKKRKKK